MKLIMNQKVLKRKKNKKITNQTKLKKRKRKVVYFFLNFDHTKKTLIMNLNQNLKLPQLINGFKKRQTK